MKLTLTVVVLVAALCATTGLPQNTRKDAPLFVRSLQDLYRGPPIPPVKSRANIETQYIEQKLNNFDDKETRTWQMRYMTNDEHFVDGGPIFIFVGGEWEISELSIMGGHFYDLAKEHHGMLYYTEHRFYGQSKPIDDITVESLQYLHVHQALADLAHFIRHIRATNPALANSKVIMSGCSYSATMVVWFKRIYPELMDGGWASSAPILAKVDFREYKEVVGRAMRELGSEQCYARIQNGIAEMESMFAQRRGAEVRAMLKLCSDFNEYNDLDLWSLFGGISNIFSGLVQYQYEGDIPYYCDWLMQHPDDVTAIANFILVNWGDEYCVDATYKSTIDYYSMTGYELGASRPWYFQTCNEYGWYQTSSSSNQPFGTKFPTLLYITMCGDIFGKSMYNNGTLHTYADTTNVHFGGMEPNVKDVYMTHGGMDPWSPMGPTEDDGATIIPRASHCADLSSIDEFDSAAMRASKEHFAQLVREWLTDSAADSGNSAQ